MPKNAVNDELTQKKEKAIAAVLGKLCGTSKGRTLIFSKTYDDIALEAISYAANNKGIDWADADAEQHLYYTAKKVSGWMASKEKEKAKRSPFHLILKGKNDGDDENQDFLDKVATKHSLEEYKIKQGRTASFALGRDMLGRLNAFLANKGVSKRNIAVYKDWELYKKPTDVVCKEYDIKKSNLYKIICTINAILAQHGRALLRAA